MFLSHIHCIRLVIVFILCVSSMLISGVGEEDTEIVDITDAEKGGEAIDEVFNDRAEHVIATCTEYSSEISERYREVWPKESYQTVLRRADVFINKNVGFLWCRVPKAASESWTSVFIKKW